MSSGEYSFTISRDSTNPEGRETTLRRVRAMLTHFPSGIPDRANCFFYGLTKGWVIADVIGHADADEIDDLLPARPSGGVSEAIPYGRDPVAPEVEALPEEYIIEQTRDGHWFEVWMGIKNDLFFFRRDGKEMPERSIMAWLGYLRGVLEGNHISQPEYEKLRAMLPPVDDDLTPIVAATP